VVHLLDEFLAAVFGHLGKVEADANSVAARVDSEVALLDRLLDGAEHRLVVRGDHELPRLGHGDVRHLVERSLDTVILDVNAL
jgi:hypothetical protein